MLFTDIALIDENLDYREHQWVGVLDGKIDYIGDAEPADAAKYGEAYDGTGKLSNGSGCGNETASERKMFRKYIVDPVSYWAKEYHIDGFRFDLMGLMDVKTMNGIRADLNALPDGNTFLTDPEACPRPVYRKYKYYASSEYNALINQADYGK